MKKIMFPAVICVVLAACSKTEYDAPISKAGEIITLKAGVTIPETKVQPVDLSSETINFKWEEGDKVTICNESGTSTFTVVSSTINGGSADFSGAALSDMSSYKVYYNYDGDTTKVHQAKYIEGSFRPFVNGSGDAGGFVMNEFMPVLRFTLTKYSEEEVYTVGRICYYVGCTDEVSHGSESHHSRPLRTELIFEDGLTLSKTEKAEVYFPISCVSDPSGFTIDFYDTGGNLFDVSPDSTWSDLWYMAPEINLSEHINKIVSFDDTLEACLAAGTLVTMADGTFKKIEDIVTGDRVMTFDHEKGGLSSSEISFTYKGDKKIIPLVLSFFSGKELSIVGTHDILEECSLKYVRINSGNVARYVGKRFYNAEAACWDTLTGYKQGQPTEYYCIYSAYHINCIADGMLTCPDDLDFCLNVYELDDQIKADAARLAADIAAYGLYDFNESHPEYASDPAFSLVNKFYRNLNIAFGKGLVSKEEMMARLNDAASSGKGEISR